VIIKSYFVILWRFMLKLSTRVSVTLQCQYCCALQRKDNRPIAVAALQGKIMSVSSSAIHFKVLGVIKVTFAGKELHVLTSVTSSVT